MAAVAQTAVPVLVGDTLVDGRGVRCIVERVSTATRGGDRSVLLDCEDGIPRQVWLSRLTSEYARS